MVIDSEKIFQLKLQIAELLQQRPEYTSFQREIEEKLKNAGNQHNRLILIHKMMMDKALELKAALVELNNKG